MLLVAVTGKCSSFYLNVYQFDISHLEVMFSFYSCMSFPLFLFSDVVALAVSVY